LESPDADFRYVEQIECWRQIKGVRNGAMVVDSAYESGEGYDEGENPHLECHACDGVIVFEFDPAIEIYWYLE
jgi:hypothetical protein